MDILKVLLIWASPPKLEPLRIAEEERTIRSNFERLGKTVLIHTLPACQIGDLNTTLMREKYHMIHFSGHVDRNAKLVSTLLEKYISAPLLRSLANQKLNDKFTGSLSAFIDKVESDLCDSASNSSEYLMPILNAECRFDDSLPRGSSKIPFVDAVSNDDSDEHAMDSVERVPKRYRFEYCGPVFDAATIGEAEAVLQIDESFSLCDLLGMGVGSLCIHSDVANSSYARVSAIEFGRCLLNYQSQLRCVVLNACSSIFIGSLLRHFVPYAVCIKGRLSDVESSNFTMCFYKSICEGKLFSRAFAECKSYCNLKNTEAGTPRRPLDKPTSSIIRILANKTLIANTFSWSINAILSSALTGSDQPIGNKDISCFAYEEKINQLQKLVANLSAENETLVQEKVKMAQTIADGTMYLQNMLKEMARLQEMVSDLTMVGAQAILQMKTTKNVGSRKQLPVAMATLANSSSSSSSSSSSYSSVSGKSVVKSNRPISVAKAVVVRSQSKPAGTAKAIKAISADNSQTVSSVLLHPREAVEMRPSVTAHFKRVMSESKEPKAAVVSTNKIATSSDVLPAVKSAPKAQLLSKATASKPPSSQSDQKQLQVDESIHEECKQVKSPNENTEGNSTEFMLEDSREVIVGKAAAETIPPRSPVLSYSPPRPRPKKSAGSKPSKLPVPTASIESPIASQVCITSSTPLTSQANSKDPALSLRDFIAIRRAAIDKSRQAKPSSSFASAVPRFEKSKHEGKEST